MILECDYQTEQFENLNPGDLFEKDGQIFLVIDGRDARLYGAVNIQTGEFLNVYDELVRPVSGVMKFRYYSNEEK